MQVCWRNKVTALSNIRDIGRLARMHEKPMTTYEVSLSSCAPECMPPAAFILLFCVPLILAFHHFANAHRSKKWSVIANVVNVKPVTERSFCLITSLIYTLQQGLWRVVKDQIIIVTFLFSCLSHSKRHWNNTNLVNLCNDFKSGTRSFISTRYKQMTTNGRKYDVVAEFRKKESSTW